ncbi:MAG TPA: hypothetical protein VF483_12110 [Gemmatimonadaceae bacterium]
MNFRRLSVLTLLVAPILLACSDSISAPKIASTSASATLDRDRAMPGQKNGFNQGTDQAALVWCESHGPASASADIGPSGGIIAVGNARLILPAGALSTTVHVTASQPGGHNAMVTFEPSGLQFKKPAGLQFDVSGCDVGDYTPDVVYMNDEGVIVERIDAVYSNYWHQVAAPINHFSNYALAW